MQLFGLCTVTNKIDWGFMARFCILGLGRTGISTAQYLRTMGHELIVWDDDAQKQSAAEMDGFTLWSEAFSWDGVTLIASPGIEKHTLMNRARHAHCRVISDIQLFNETFPHIRTIGVTGSNGKTTTCALIHHGLTKYGIPCVLAGNIGVPIFSTVHHGQPQDAVYILELSSYQLELSNNLNIDIAIILNLFPHHLERHGTMDQYRAIKQSLLNHARIGWIPFDWPIPVDSHASIGKKEKVALASSGVLGVHSPDARAENWAAQPCKKEKVPSPHTRSLHTWSTEMLDGYHLPHFLQTKHNRDNAAAAVAALWAFECYDFHGFQDFTGLEHRQEIVGCWNSVIYCNDSKATNPHAAALALQACPKGPVFWIAGGVQQNDDLSILDDWAHRITHGFVIGSAKYRYAEWLKSHNRPATLCASLADAVEKSGDKAISFLQEHPNSEKYQVTSPGILPSMPSGTGDGTYPSTTVLFSPGCASFDQFRDFEHRGQVFKDCVKIQVRSRMTQKDGA